MKVIESPCIKVCKIHPVLKHCTGCFRSLTEIGMWTKYTDEQRNAIMKELNIRRNILKRQK